MQSCNQNAYQMKQMACNLQKKHDTLRTIFVSIRHPLHNRNNMETWLFLLNLYIFLFPSFELKHCVIVIFRNPTTYYIKSIFLFKHLFRCFVLIYPELFDNNESFAWQFLFMVTTKLKTTGVSVTDCYILLQILLFFIYIVKAM